MALLLLALLIFVPGRAQAQGEAQDGEEGERGARTWERGEVQEGPGRRTLSAMGREELEESGFVFENTLEDRSRAHATVFALAAGAVVHGAGHWQLEDRRTAFFLLGMELVGLSLIGGGTALALNPTGVTHLDERRRDLWFLGIGVLGTSWMIDIAGTAFRDDLGIPPPTSREIGWGVGLGYEYWRPRDLSLRHLSTAQLSAKTERFHLEGRTSQELGYGMSDYEMTGRWFWLRGPSRESRLGLEMIGRYLTYRLDEPFERTDAQLNLTASLNMGRFFAHLDQLSIGGKIGAGIRGYRFVGTEGDWRGLTYAGWYLPMEVFVALNLTSQLRMDLSFQRWQGDWLERSRGRIGVPRLGWTYRSTERLDLNFFFSMGDGVAAGAGLQFWIGE